MFLIGLAAIIVCFCLVVAILDGQMSTFINTPSLLAILIPLLGVVAATGSFETLIHGFKAVVSPKAEITEETRGRAATLFRLLSKTTAISAALITLICLVNMLYALDFTNPNALNSIGSNIAASLISLTYGLILVMAVFEPAVFILKKRYTGKR